MTRISIIYLVNLFVYLYFRHDVVMNELFLCLYSFCLNTLKIDSFDATFQAYTRGGRDMRYVGDDTVN